MLLRRAEAAVPHDDLECLSRDSHVDQTVSTTASNVVGTGELLPVPSSRIVLLNDDSGFLCTGRTPGAESSPSDPSYCPPAVAGDRKPSIGRPWASGDPADWESTRSPTLARHSRSTRVSRGWRQRKRRRQRPNWAGDDQRQSRGGNDQRHVTRLAEPEVEPSSTADDGGVCALHDW